jgi:hypothetical protein
MHWRRCRYGAEGFALRVLLQHDLTDFSEGLFRRDHFIPSNKIIVRSGTP